MIGGNYTPPPPPPRGYINTTHMHTRVSVNCTQHPPEYVLDFLDGHICVGNYSKYHLNLRLSSKLPFGNAIFHFLLLVNVNANSLISSAITSARV